jgi:hypothetical protein
LLNRVMLFSLILLTRIKIAGWRETRLPKLWSEADLA